MPSDVAKLDNRRQISVRPRRILTDYRDAVYFHSNTFNILVQTLIYAPPAGDAEVIYTTELSP